MGLSRHTLEPRHPHNGKLILTCCENIRVLSGMHASRLSVLSGQCKIQLQVCGAERSRLACLSGCGTGPNHMPESKRPRHQSHAACACPAAVGSGSAAMLAAWPKLGVKYTCFFQQLCAKRNKRSTMTWLFANLIWQLQIADAKKWCIVSSHVDQTLPPGATFELGHRTAEAHHLESHQSAKRVAAFRTTV